LIFASPSPGYMVEYVRSLVGLQGDPQFLSFYTLPPIQPQTWIALTLGILLSFPFFPRLMDTLNDRWPASEKTLSVVEDIFLFCLLILSLLVIANSTYEAYIYGRF